MARIETETAVTVPGARRADVEATARGTRRTPGRSRRSIEPVVLGLLTAAAGAAIALVLPPGGDAPAHLYRTLLFDRGVHVWDLLWYGGHYPLASYSLLYYPLAALVGNVPLAVAACAASATLFAWLVLDEWGEGTRWAARAFAAFSLSALLAGTYSYGVAGAALLATVWAVRRGRTAWAIVGAAVTLGMSPLAFLFLVLVLAAAADGRLRRRHAGFAIALVALAGLQAGVLARFPTPGRYPYPVGQLLLGLLIFALGLALVARLRRARLVGAFVALLAAANVVAFAVPSALGSNMLRPRAAVFPLLLIPAGLARFRPRALVAVVLASAFAWSVGPQAMSTARLLRHAPEARATFWAPALAYLRSNWRPGHRVEVVPTLAHWEAYWLPRAGFPLARGWYRQLDMVANGVLYEPDLSPATYRSWLDRMAVRFVVVPKTALGPFGAEREARLARARATGLEPVFRSGRFTIYEVPAPVPLLGGPGLAEVTRLDADGVAGRVSATGSYRLGVRYTRYWDVASGPVCVSRSADGMTRVTARSPGRFVLVVRARPADLLAGGDARRCHRSAAGTTPPAPAKGPGRGRITGTASAR